MRRVDLIESQGETYRYAAVDRETGAVLLRLSDRAALVALCERLEWVLDAELKARKGRGLDAADSRKRTSDHRAHS